MSLAIRIARAKNKRENIFFAGIMDGMTGIYPQI